MSFTRSEAKSVLALIDFKKITDEVGAVLIKLQDQHPQLFLPSSSAAGVAVQAARKSRDEGRRNAMGRISELVAEAQAAVTKAEDLATQFGLSFSIDVSGYGGDSFDGENGGWSASRC